jgi:hypothetical protein
MKNSLRSFLSFVFCVFLFFAIRVELSIHNELMGMVPVEVNITSNKCTTYASDTCCITGTYKFCAEHKTACGNHEKRKRTCIVELNLCNNREHQCNCENMYPIGTTHVRTVNKNKLNNCSTYTNFWIGVYLFRSFMILAILSFFMFICGMFN